ncbi:MAG: hypothetical protein LBC71_03045 [Oscillospiraceae bacterium]|jgi:N-acetylglucosamine kinase-like BadF-type ATPase|nr:hypothetical protein [Oscillospiraceae bacterium]
MKYILGIDGGGTKSHLTIFDENGKCISSLVYGTLNHENMEESYTELERRLNETINKLLSDARLTVNDITYSVLGIAGVDTKAQQEKISNMVTRIGLQNITVCNDAFLGVAAGCPSCVGICVINGTGFKLAAIDNSGILLDTCGLGAYTTDWGGGPFYGNRACGEVYNALYKNAKPTIMQEMVFDVIGIKEKEEYLDRIADILYGESKIDIIALNSIPFKAAQKGDKVAKKILKASVKQYVGAIIYLATNLDFPQEKTLYITLAGSVFVKQEIKLLQEMIKKRLAKKLNNRPIEYNTLAAPPVAGAIKWAALKAGFDIDITKIEDELSNL